MERCYSANMCMVKAELLNEHRSFCFEALSFHRSKLVLVRRAFGHFSERLFTFWQYQKPIELPALKVLELPFVFHDPACEPTHEANCADVCAASSAP